MPHPALLPSLALAALPALLAAEQQFPPQLAPFEQLAQLTIRERVIIRVPAGRVPTPQAPRPVRLVEKSGPKCVAIDRLAGAAVVRTDAVDLILSDGKRYRAVLEDDCPALAFYGGFYLKRGPDGQLCADRDSVRSRAGASCPITRFKRLVEKR